MNMKQLASGIVIPVADEPRQAVPIPTGGLYGDSLMRDLEQVVNGWRETAKELRESDGPHPNSENYATRHAEVLEECANDLDEIIVMDREELC